MTGSIPTWAVIPTAGRPCLIDSMNAVLDQVDGVMFVVNNGYTIDPGGVPKIHVAPDTDPEPNISRWWNVGLDAVARRCVDRGIHRWNVIVLNDDTVMAPGSVSVLTAGLRRHRAAQLAFCGETERLLLSPGPDRITGWCFALRGEGSLRADESLKWWAGDNDLDWRARAAGGSVIVPGVKHEHMHPNGYTVADPKLTEQAGRDMAAFIQKWGRAAW